MKQLDDRLQVISNVAKSLHISDDGKVNTFSLRDDIYFQEHVLFGSDSRRTIVKNFEYSFKRSSVKEYKGIASPSGWIFQNINHFSTTDDAIFKIELKQVFLPFFGLRGMKYFFIVSKEAIEYFGIKYRENLIGTGPFQFSPKSAIKNLLRFQISLKRNVWLHI